MASIIDTLLYVLDIDATKAKAGAKQGEAALGGLNKAAGTLIASLRAMAGVFAIRELSQFALGAAKAADRLDVLRSVTANLGNIMGVAAEDIDRMTTRLQSLGLRQVESFEAIQEFLVSGLPLDQLDNLVERTGALAKLTGEDLYDAFRRVSDVIATGRAGELKRLGLIVDTEGATKALAKSLGIEVTELTEAEKRAASFSAVMESLNTLQQASGKTTETTTTALHDLSDAWDDFKESIGGPDGPLTLLIELLTKVIDKVSALTTLLNLNRGFDLLKAGFSGDAKKFKEQVDEYSAAWDKLLGVQKKATDDVSGIKQNPLEPDAKRIKIAVDELKKFNIEFAKADAQSRALGVSEEERQRTLHSIVVAQAEQLEPLVAAGKATEGQVALYFEILKLLEEFPALIEGITVETSKWNNKLSKVANTLNEISGSVSRIFGDTAGGIVSGLSGVAQNLASGNLVGAISGAFNTIFDAFSGGETATEAQSRLTDAIYAQISATNALADQMRAAREDVDATTLEELRAQFADIEQAMALAADIASRGGSPDALGINQGLLAELNKILARLGLPAGELTGGHGLVQAGTGNVLEVVLQQFLAQMRQGIADVSAFTNPFTGTTGRVGVPDEFKDMLFELGKLSQLDKLNYDLATQLLAFWTEFGDLSLEQQEEIAQAIYDLLNQSGDITPAQQRELTLLLQDLQAAIDEAAGGGKDGLTQVERSITTITEGQANVMTGLLNSILFVLSDINDKLGSALDRFAQTYGGGLPGFSFGAGSIVIYNTFRGGDASQMTAKSIHNAIRMSVRARGIAV